MSEIRTQKIKEVSKPKLGSDNFYESENGKYCANCGREVPTKLVPKGIWNFGVRKVIPLYLCKDCEEF